MQNSQSESKWLSTTKSEIRISKSETNSKKNLKSGKSETLNPKEFCLEFNLFWSLEIVSNFGFRASNIYFFFISSRSRSALSRRRQPPTIGSARSAAPRCEFLTAPAHLRPRWRSPPGRPQRRLRRPPWCRATSAAKEFPSDLLRYLVSRRLW